MQPSEIYKMNTSELAFWSGFAHEMIKLENKGVK